MQVLKLLGAHATDVVFGLNLPGLPNLIWNITRIERDAFKGEFGRPEVMRFDQLTQGIVADPDANLDLAKVQWMMGNPKERVVRPFYKTAGRSIIRYQVLDIPCIAVRIALPNGHITIPVDGNHRMAARERLGMPSFRRFVVPPDREGDYRVIVEQPAL